jgi:catechol 2,3-dioxygenase-like lactoylglutathione lyase family enzyme
MPSIETYRKRAKQLLRWHRERNYSIGAKLRLLPRYRQITDASALEMQMPLTLAQEVVAVEAGFSDWAELKAGAQREVPATRPESQRFSAAVPILFVRDVPAAAAFYRDKLGFQVDFLHGNPPFYGAVSRGDACLHLRLVHEPNFAELAAREGSLILASIEVTDVKVLFEEFEAGGVEFPQRLVRQIWGGIDFYVRDPDGNVISFVQYLQSP